jgi:uncharacterized protein involved in response to NO
MAGRSRVLLSIAFRPFFLLGAIFAVVAVLLWLAALHGAGWLPAAADPVTWHAHEMLFGFAGAAVAGFLLTAVATWTGRPPVSGAALQYLVAAWIAGRLAMALGQIWPGAAVAVAVTELAFPVLLAGLAIREIVGGASRRNFGIAFVITAFAVLDVVFHLGQTGVWPGAARTALFLTAHGFLVLITVIAGRIVPSFTGNWLRSRGIAALPTSRPWLETLIVPAVLLAGIANSSMAPAPLVAGLSIAVAFLHGLRLSTWCGSATVGEPLVVILHIAYAWLPVGYLLLGLVALGLPLPGSAALHALTMGAVATMILAVATRVALGHTGRPLTASPLTVVAYGALNVAVLARIGSPLVPEWSLVLMDTAAAGWVAAFGLFLAVYWGILTRPRL